MIHIWPKIYPRAIDLPSRAEIFSYWCNRLHLKGIWIDWGEPSCWACGFHYGTKYDIRRSDAPWSEILRCWERVPLQRCHISHRSLCGLDTVDNLFLMCRECHDLAPNTNIPEIFFEWARRQNHSMREEAKFKEAMRSFGLAEKDIPELGRVMTSEAFLAWMRDRSGIHRPQSGYASLSARATPATYIGLAVHFMRNAVHRI